MNVQDTLKAGEALWLNVRIKSFPYLLGLVVLFVLAGLFVFSLYRKSVKDVELSRQENKALERTIAENDITLKKIRADNELKNKALSEATKNHEIMALRLDHISSFYTNGDWLELAKSYQSRVDKN